MAVVLIDGTDIKTAYGFRLSEPPGWLDAPPRVVTTAQIVGRAGATRLETPREQPRQLVLRGVVRGSTAAVARANLDSLKQLFAKASNEITLQDWPTRYIVATLDSLTVPPASASLISRDLSVEIALTANDPYSYETTLSAPAVGAALPLGTGPVRPTVSVLGAAAGPIVMSLYNKAAVLMQSLTFDATAIPGGQTLVVNHDLRTAVMNGTNWLSKIVSGDFFVIDPADQANYGAPGPTISITGGGTGSISYRKVWR